jgi:hypothetical protein
MPPHRFLDRMLEEPFESFEFGVTGAAVYQLGQFGTAASDASETWRRRASVVR